ncbi:hypothetical protein [Pseudoponticoccus marisrubri]|nr:hypothetical protein [Pseudoponticoccus marisrubri]
MIPKDRRARTATTAPDDAAFDSWLNILFLAAFPLLLWLFRGSFAGVATALMALWIFSIGLRLIAHGHRLHQAYDAAPVARRPRLPRKILGSALIGVMVLILAGHQFATLMPPLLMGLTGMALSLAAFGPDPLRDKGEQQPVNSAALEVEAAQARLEDVLVELTDRIAALQDADLTRRSEATRAMVLRCMRSIGHTPEERARILKPVTRFAEMLETETARLEDAARREDFRFARRRFVAKLDVMAESFEERARRHGLRGGRDVFDMEADFLLERMPRESAA